MPKTSFRDRRRAKRSRKDFQAAQSAAGPDHMVCGTVGDDGRPLYFVMARGASDEAIEHRAFEVRYGRPIERGELMLLQAARARQVKDRSVDA